MAQDDYLPIREGDRLALLENLVRQGREAAGLWSEEDLAALGSACERYRLALQEKLKRRAEALAATAEFNQISAEVLAGVRARVRYLKAHPGYREELGLTLGIEGPEIVPPERAMKPVLRALRVVPGEVTLGFKRYRRDGLEVLCRRGGEQEMALLGRYSTSPVIDRRPNLGEGPETRCYIGLFLVKDRAVGTPSNILTVTVPASDTL